MARIVLFIASAGAAGGLLNAGLSGTGLILPDAVNLPGQHAVLPGFLGNVFVGAVAALLSFGLYGPLSGAALLRAKAPADQQPGAAPAPAPTPIPTQLTLAALAGAMLVGFSGGRWVTAEADQQLSRATAELTAGAAEKALQGAATQPPQAETKAPGQPPFAVHQFNRLEPEPTPGAAAPAPPAGATAPRQPLAAALQAIRTSPPREAYQKALDLQRMVNSPADGR
jgi:hypothetical protein